MIKAAFGCLNAKFGREIGDETGRVVNKGVEDKNGGEREKQK